MTEEPGRLHSMGHKESDRTEPLTLSLSLTSCAYCVDEMNIRHSNDAWHKVITE